MVNLSKSPLSPNSQSKKSPHSSFHLKNEVPLSLGLPRSLDSQLVVDVLLLLKVCLSLALSVKELLLLEMSEQVVLKQDLVVFQLLDSLNLNKN